MSFASHAPGPPQGRVSTGAVELDRMIGGGFMRGDSVMVAGSAGTGKTTLALQYLVHGAAINEPGIYLSFEQLPDQLYRDAKNFGWDLQRLEAENTLRVICSSPNLLIEENGAAMLLEEPIKEIGARRIVVDSLSHLSMFVKEHEMRLQVYSSLMLFKTKGLSSLLIWEAPQMAGQSFTISDSGMSFLVDTIVMLKFVEIESTIKNALVIMKMRGSAHDKRLREYRITRNGIEVEASFSQYVGLMTGSPVKTPSEDFADMFSKAVTQRK